MACWQVFLFALPLTANDFGDDGPFNGATFLTFMRNNVAGRIISLPPVTVRREDASHGGGGGSLPSPIDYDHHFTARFTMTPAGHCFP